MEYSEQQYIKAMGKRMKELRVALSMTQLDVAVKCGIEENAFQRIESGRTNPSTKTLIKITNALNISMKEFFQFDL